MPNLNLAKTSLRDERLELALGVGPLEEHVAKGQLVMARFTKPRPISLTAWRIDAASRVPPQIDEKALPPGFKHAVHFAEGLQRLGEVLKRRAAEQEVEAVFLERHAGGVP